MANRNSHTGKSKLQRDSYSRAVYATGYNQTSDESLAFDNSDNARIIEDDQNDSIRKEPLKYKAKSLWEEHKFEIIMSFITVICIPGFLFFAIKLNREAGEHEVQITSLNKDVSELKEDIKQQSDLVNELSKSDVENQKYIEYLQKNVEKMESTIEKLSNKLEK